MRTGRNWQVSQLLPWDLGSMGQQLVCVTHICVDSQTRGVLRAESNNPCASSLKLCLEMLRYVVISDWLAAVCLALSTLHATFLKSQSTDHWPTDCNLRCPTLEE